MPSAREQQKVVDDYLAEECGKGHVLGPLRLVLSPQVHPNRFGVNPKGPRDMSFPTGSLVNDIVLKKHCAL